KPARPWSALAAAGATGCGETVFVGADGRTFKALLAETTVADRGGLRTRSLVRDLSGERGMTEVVRRAEERFHRFFDESPVGIVLLDAEGTVVECSTAFARMASAEAAALAGQPLWHCVSE